jgi:hypothetical protein
MATRDPRVARGHAFDAQKRADAVGSAAWTSVSIDETDKLITEMDAGHRDKSRDNMLVFAHRAAQLGDKHSIPGYLAECARTHPGYESAVSYIDLDDGDLLSRPRDSGKYPSAPPTFWRHCLPFKTCLTAMLGR